MYSVCDKVKFVCEKLIPIIFPSNKSLRLISPAHISAMDAQRTLLDELMGAARNNLTDEEKKGYRELKWDDREVCACFMVRFCPHDLFVNTRSDLGYVSGQPYTLIPMCLAKGVATESSSSFSGLTQLRTSILIPLFGTKGSLCPCPRVHDQKLKES